MDEHTISLKQYSSYQTDYISRFMTIDIITLILSHLQSPNRGIEGLNDILSLKQTCKIYTCLINVYILSSSSSSLQSLVLKNPKCIHKYNIKKNHVKSYKAC